MLTIEGGAIVEREVREKLSHKHFSHEEHDHDHDHGNSHEGDQPHGFDAASQSRHTQMSEAIQDCEALICRGMGSGAYESMKQRGIRPFVTDIAEVDAAALAYAAGTLVDHVEKLH